LSGEVSLKDIHGLNFIYRFSGFSGGGSIYTAASVNSES
jgi:hypothetical protein